MSDSLWLHGLQHARLPCPSPTPRACTNSCESNQWFHPTNLSSVIPLSFWYWLVKPTFWFSYWNGRPLKCFSSVQLLSCIQLFATPWTAAYQVSLSITNSQSLLKLRSLASVRPSKQLKLCHPLPLPPSTFPSIRVFSCGSVLHIRWPKYWSFSFSISP